MKVLKVHCGNFSSLENFYQSVGLSLKESNNADYEKAELDCRFMSRNRTIRISVLTSLLALAYGFKQRYNSPCEILIPNDSSVLTFLIDSNFYFISHRDNVINWKSYEQPEKEILIIRRAINCKLISYSENENLKSENITFIKNSLQSNVTDFLVAEFTSLLSTIYLSDRRLVINLLSRVIPEYVINSIVHGKSSCYIGMQVSKKGISVCISDSGIGILNSLRQNYNSAWVKKVKIDNDINALLNASLKHNIRTGLRESVDTIVEHNGYTVISTGNAEIVWGKRGWNDAISRFDHENYQDILQDFTQILKYPLQGYYSKEDLIDQGGYKIFDYKLAGTRIFFEVPF